MKFTEVANILNIPEEVVFEAGEYAVTTPGHNGDLPMVVKFSQEKSRTSTLILLASLKGLPMSSLHGFRHKLLKAKRSMLIFCQAPL